MKAKQMEQLQNDNDPLAEAKTVCHLCKKPHLHGPYNHEYAVSLNRYRRRESIKTFLGFFGVPAGFVGFIGLLYLTSLLSPPSPPSLPLSAQEEQIRVDRINKIDAALGALQDERDELDPPPDQEPPDRY
jgi:hypothetical protein